MKRIAIIAGALALAACGQTAALEPPPGQSLPPKPLLAATTPTAEELLTPPTYANPQRIDELIKRSQPRRTDPFDLPPPSGGAAPPAPAGTDPEPVSDETGPVTPQ